MIGAAGVVATLGLERLDAPAWLLFLTAGLFVVVAVGLDWFLSPGRARLLLLLLASSYLVIAGWALWPQTGQSPPPQILAWGWRDAGNSTYALVDASNVTREFRKQFALVLVTRTKDDTYDPLRDEVIDKSRVFEMPDSRVEIVVPPSQQSIRRLLANRIIEVYLLCVPRSLEPQDFKTIGEARDKKAIVCDSKAFSGPLAEVVP